MIDLHVHSTASDGTFSPEQLVKRALHNRVTSIALTDHDCYDGLEQALASGKKHNLQVIPGIEISVNVEAGTFHMLGYFIDYHNKDFQKIVLELQEARKKRNPKMISRLNNLGIDITLEDVIAESSGGQIGRVHFARALVKHGWVSGIQEAFDKYLAKGRPVYCKKAFLSAEEAIKVIEKANGLAVIGHPFTLGLTEDQLDALLSDLKQYGLAGLEVYYLLHGREQIKTYEKLAEKYSLVKTGGTDFHGDNKPAADIGKGLLELGFKNDAVRELQKLLQ